MSKKYDAAIIGAGVIGCAISFELAKKGYKTLNLDKHPAAGFGSSSNSCAVIRLNYSTFEGTAMAYEGFYYWHNWAEYLGVEDERGLAKFNKIGCLIIKTESNRLGVPSKILFDQLGIEYEDIDLTRLSESSRPRELPPQSLTDPDVSLSAHPAPIDQPQAVHQSSNGQTRQVDALLRAPTNVLPGASFRAAFYISALPTSSGRC